jgi:hypothetical protein
VSPDENTNATTDPATPTPGAVPRWLALVLLGVALVAGFMAVGFASDAQDARAQADLLKDGVDRSGLPLDQAVALAKLARAQSAPLPDSEIHDHDHEHGAEHRDLTPEEQATFDAQWRTAVEAAEDLRTIEQIEAAGYVRSSGETDGAGEHWTNWELVDAPFDPARPSQILLDELVWGEGLELIAFSYWVTSDGPPEGFAGDLDVWHRHRGVCFRNGQIMDENRQPEECPGQDWFNGENLWMLHAWVVPGVENDYGIFHNVNPLLCERACGLED